MKALPLAGLLPLLAGRAGACAVCFGKSDGNRGLADGFWWGIVLLLLVTMSLVGGIGWVLWSVEKGRGEVRG